MCTCAISVAGNEANERLHAILKVSKLAPTQTRFSSTHQKSITPMMAAQSELSKSMRKEQIRCQTITIFPKIKKQYSIIHRAGVFLINEWLREAEHDFGDFCKKMLLTFLKCSSFLKVRAQIFMEILSDSNSFISRVFCVRTHLRRGTYHHL